MTRIIAIALVLGVAIGLPASALGQGSGEDAYTQEVPTAGGDDDAPTGTGTDDTAAIAGTEGTASGTAAGTGTGTASGTATGTGSGIDPATGAQLPRTGSETGILAAIGIALLGFGLLLRRQTRTG